VLELPLAVLCVLYLVYYTIITLIPFAEIDVRLDAARA
jgi:hypothetical protein